MPKKKVIFICTHNSLRSQMAEGWLRHLYGDRYDSMSAGAKPAGVNPTAVEVMRVVGIDISGQRSTHLDEYIDARPDYVITLCDSAAKDCPIFPGEGKRIHRSTFDPGAAVGSEEFILNEFRRIRDELGAWIKEEFA